MNGKVVRMNIGWSGKYHGYAGITNDTAFESNGEFNIDIRSEWIIISVSSLTSLCYVYLS